MADPLRIRLHGDITNGFPAVGQCVWCGTVCWTMAITPFRPDLGAVPLHLFCTAELRDAYKAWQAGQIQDHPDAAIYRRGLEHLQRWIQDRDAPRLSSGHGTSETGA
jgi:hypothetical protein